MGLFRRKTQKALKEELFDLYVEQRISIPNRIEKYLTKKVKEAAKLKKETLTIDVHSELVTSRSFDIEEDSIADRYVILFCKKKWF